MAQKKVENMTEEEKYDWYHGKKRTKEELDALRKKIGSSPAKIKAIKRGQEVADKRDYLMKRQGGKYEAQSAVGEARSAADRERHMKLVLGDDWKPSDEGYLAQRKILNKMDKRNRALDPENDPGFLSALRNKTGILPTAAGDERRVMARNAARREQERLYEGEAGGALAGSAAEKIREARIAREAIEKDKDFRVKRDKDYKQFLGGRGALEVAEEPTTGGLEDLGTEALREKKLQGMAQHAQYRDREIRDKDAVGGLEGLGTEASEIARDIASRRKRIEAEEGPQVASGAGDEVQKTGFIQKSLRDLPLVGGLFGEEEKDMLGDGQVAEEATSKLGAGGRMQKAPWEEQKAQREKELATEEADMRKAGVGGGGGEFIKDTSEAGKTAAEGEFAASMNQDEARDAISGLDEEEANAVGQEIMRLKGPGSDEYIDAKESMLDKNGERRYVRYEAGGPLIIDMARLKIDIQENKNMAKLKHLPMHVRGPMMVEWGLMDKSNLSIIQKKSAKQLKEESLLDLKIANAEVQKEKLQRALDPKDKIAFDAAHKGMLDAAKNGKYGLADMYRKKINDLNPDSDTTDYEEVFEKGIQRNKKLTPQKLFTAAGLKNGESYYKSRLDISKSISLFKKSSAGNKSKSLDDLLDTTVESGPNAGDNYGQLLTAHGVYSWAKIKAAKTAGTVPEGVPELAMKDEEAYMNYVLPKIKNSLLKGVWGNLHTQVESLQSIESEKVKKQLAKDVVTPSSFGHEDYVPTDHVKVAEDERKAKVKKAEKVKAGKVKAKEDEITKYNSTVREGRGVRQKTNAEKKADFMKEGTKRLDALVKGKTIKGRKKALGGHPLFNSTEEAIKYYKDNPSKLKDMSLAFRHFISQK